MFIIILKIAIDLSNFKIKYNSPLLHFPQKIATKKNYYLFLKRERDTETERNKVMALKKETVRGML